MSTQDLQAVVLLQASLHARAKYLRPAVVPKQFHSLRDARNFASTSKDRAAIEAVLREEVR
jgi:hypothetical protein